MFESKKLLSVYSTVTHPSVVRNILLQDNKSNAEITFNNDMTVYRCQYSKEEISSQGYGFTIIYQKKKSNCCCDNTQ